ncbi:MAG: hypothetical protein PHV61_00335 [Limnochordia bacterium]|jgi:hypothetical protein|nr:hypothetical protein [Limnochordia bacterium]MDD2628607.1 hypothetical protein [Limnochordia bacterium]MDD4518117.1 hypothetical protein [Limnochordia bacterium]
MTRPDRIHVTRFPEDGSFATFLTSLGQLPPDGTRGLSAQGKAAFLSRALSQQGITMLTATTLPFRYNWITLVQQFFKGNPPFVLLAITLGSTHRIAWGVTRTGNYSASQCLVIRSLVKTLPNLGEILGLPGVLDCFVTRGYSASFPFLVTVLVRPGALEAVELIDRFRPCTVTIQPRAMLERSVEST